jgi:hypothetical protein
MRIVTTSVLIVAIGMGFVLARGLGGPAGVQRPKAAPVAVAAAGTPVLQAGIGAGAVDSRMQASSTAPGASSTSVPEAIVPANPRLQAKLLAMLPPGTALQDAAAGFTNQGLFVAAVHVSNNLGVSFTELRTRIVEEGLSLGQAIQAARPMANNATVAARVGEHQAAADLRW